MDLSMPPAPGDFAMPATSAEAQSPAAAPFNPQVAASQALVPYAPTAQQPAVYSQPVPGYGGFYEQALAGDPFLMADPSAPMAEVGAAAAAPAVQPAPNMLGLTILAVGAGAAMGALFAGGPLGVLGGAVLGGAAVNGLRAAKEVTQGTPEADKAAVVDGSFALAGAALAVYALYRAKKASGDEGDDESDDDSSASKSGASSKETE